MKKIILLSLFFFQFVSSQQIETLPLPLGAGSAEVLNHKIYLFGGSNNWSGSIVYDTVYVYDGISWSVENTIPDKNLWDVETVLVGNEVYLIGGWPSGANWLRKYNLSTKEWTRLADSPNTSYTWGIAAEYQDGHIFLFTPNGNVYDYSILSNSWSTRTNSGFSGPWNLSSVLYANEIYIIGYYDSVFVKYNPVQDLWTSLHKSTYQVGGSAMGIINNLIYCAGGNNTGQSSAQYRSVLVYDVTANYWALDSLQLSGKRHWMATAEYEGGLYVLGGIDSTSYSVDIVEEIVPQGTAVSIKEKPQAVNHEFYLDQNFPNPFNPATTIRFSIGQPGRVEITIFDLTGSVIRRFIEADFPAGKHELHWDGKNSQGQVVGSGLYLCRVVSGNSSEVVKMNLIR
jgi:N-acetylneuraminic acid mutarotase